jgi:hypothetical protein
MIVNSTDSMRRVFKKYKFYTPIPDDVQKKIILSRNKTLITILKEAGSYTSYRYFILSIFLKFRGIGIPVTVKKINLFVPAFSMAIAGVLFFITVNIIMPDFIQEDYYAKKTHVIFLSGDVKLKRDGSDIKQINLKDEILENDFIVTGKDSRVAFQIGKDNLVYLKPESEFKFFSINSNLITDAQLNSGKALFKIKKTKNNSFVIRTETCEAVIRGTEFSISANDKVSIIALIKGSLEIKLKNQEKYILNEGYSAAVEDKYYVKPISDKEIIDLKRIEIFNFYDKIDREKVEDINKTNKILIKENIKFDDDITKIDEKEKMPISLDEIKAKYGFLHEILFFNGKIIKGYVLERKVRYKIVVPGRIIYIRPEEIENIKRI